MSKLKTIVPIDVQSVIRRFPAKSFVHSVELNADKTAVEIVWDNDGIFTGRTYPVDYPASRLTPDLDAPVANAVDKPRKAVKRV